MQSQSTNDDEITRVLTHEELSQVSGGAIAEARGRTFNPQPDPPGVMHNPPGY